MTDPTPLCESLLFFCQFVFATRSEVKKVIFWTLQNHGILGGRTISAFCVFQNLGRESHRLSEKGGAGNVWKRRAAGHIHSIILFLEGPRKTKTKKNKKRHFVTIVEEKKTGTGKNVSRERLRNHWYLIEFCFFLTCCAVQKCRAWVGQSCGTQPLTPSGEESSGVRETLTPSNYYYHRIFIFI